MPHRTIPAGFALCALLVACMPARAQLSVQPAAATSCTSGLTPVLGIMVDDSFAGDAGYNAAHALKTALTARGFRTVWDWENNALDHASIEVKGSVAYWRNLKGDTSTRIGAADLQVLDLTTTQALFNIHQAAPTLAFSAPRMDAFVQGVTETIAKRFCQSSD